MKLETIASVGATVIALLALVASQFPPLYTYFQSAQLAFAPPTEVVLRCSPRGVFASARLPFQNTGDAHAEIASMHLEIVDKTGALRQSFADPIVQSDQRDTVTNQPIFVPFNGKSIAPSERWVAHSAFHPELTEVDMPAFRHLSEVISMQSDRHWDTYGYEGPEFSLDSDLAERFAEVIAPQNSWVFEDGNQLVLRIVWLDEDGESHSEERSVALALAPAEAGAIKARYAPERLAKDPKFFVGCAVTL